MAVQIPLPPQFVQNVLRICGQAGARWLESLPDTIQWLEQEWRITVDAPFEDLSYNFVAPAIGELGQQLAVKIGIPIDDGEFHGEADYLRLKNGEGVIRLLAEQAGSRALLLERALPGKSIKTSFHDCRAQSIEIMIRVLKTLTAGPIPKQRFIELRQWTNKLERIDDYPEFPREYAKRAHAVFSRSDERNHILLHGDLHHMNILSHGESYVAIDPKGLIGDIKYDIGVLLNNHYGWIKHLPNADRQIANAVDRFAAEFDEAPRAIREWAFAQKVLSAYWTMTENGPRWKDQLGSARVWNL